MGSRTVFTKVIKFSIPILAWGVRSLPEDSNSGSSGGSELSAKQRHAEGAKEASEAMDDSKESTDAIKNTAKKRKL
jgi:hypothetical protein